MMRVAFVALLFVFSPLSFSGDQLLSKQVENAKTRYFCSKLPNVKVALVAYDSRSEGKAAFFWCSPDSKTNKLIVVTTKGHPWSACGDIIKISGRMPGTPLGTIQDPIIYKPLWQNLKDTSFALEKPTKKSQELARLIKGPAISGDYDGGGYLFGCYAGDWYAAFSH